MVVAQSDPSHLEHINDSKWYQFTPFINGSHAVNATGMVAVWYRLSGKIFKSCIAYKVYNKLLICLLPILGQAEFFVNISDVI